MTLKIDFPPISELENFPSPDRLRASGFMLIYQYPNPALSCHLTLRNDYDESVLDLSMNVETEKGLTLFEEDVGLREELNTRESLNVQQQFIIDYVPPTPKISNQKTVKSTKWRHPAYIWKRSARSSQDTLNLEPDPYRLNFVIHYKRSKSRNGLRKILSYTYRLKNY